MQISKSTNEGTETLTVQGQLNGASAPELETVMHALIQAEAPHFILDLGQVPLVSSAVLRVLLSGAKRMKKHQGRVLLCALQPEVKQVFDISGLTAFFGIHPTLADALAAVRPAAGAVAAAAPPASPEPVVTPPPAPAEEPAQPEPMEEEPTQVPAATLLPTAVPVLAQPATVQPGPPPVAPPAAPFHPAPPVPDSTAGTIVSAAPPAAPPPPASPVVAPGGALTPAKEPDPDPTAATAIPSAPPPRSMAPPPPPPRAAPPVMPPPPLAPPGERPKVPPLALAVALALLCLVGLGLYFFLKPSRPVTNDDRAARTASAAATGTPASDATPAPAAEESPASSPEPAASPLSDPLATAPGAGGNTPPPPPAANVTSAPGAVNFDNANSENRSAREAVLQRIEVMPLTSKDKSQLSTALDHAHGLGKLLTVSFATGRTDVGSADIENLKTALRRPELQKLVNDPTVIFVVLGFADSLGAKQKNKEISERRAQSLVDALRGPCGLLNTVHSVGMGDQQILGDSRDKNRVAEVWAVLP